MRSKPSLKPSVRPSARKRATPRQCFDETFGVQFVAGLPRTPAVYRIYGEDDLLVYVGKAKNLRRRISQYRNAKRRKKHAKMRKIVESARRLDFIACASDEEACLLEAKLIQDHRPRWNVAGAFFFLYPLIGVRQASGQDGGNWELCFTTQPELHPEFAFHGAYRSRGFTGAAFWALVELLEFVGHRVRRKGLSRKGSYVVPFRRLPDEWGPLWADFFEGRSKRLLEELILAMVDNAGARRDGRKVQKAINLLTLFWRHEAKSLLQAREAMGFELYPVPQRERDFLFLRRRFQTPDSRSGNRPTAEPEPLHPTVPRDFSGST